jgi:hypothetical protein
LASIPGKTLDYNNAKRQERLPYRQRLATFVRPIVAARVLPFVREQYPECGGCQVCWSFVRRYQKNERVKHDMHFDIHALVTVVVSLSSEGIDFDGGLYVSTGSSRRRSSSNNNNNNNSASSRYYLPLQTGDAVVHQSDLLHGVRVTSGERWSWIMWLKEDGCQSHPSSWRYTEKNQVEQVEQVDQPNQTTIEDPISLFLRAKRTNNVMVKKKLLLQSSTAGFGRASNELGMMYSDGALDSTLAAATNRRGGIEQQRNHKAMALLLKGSLEQSDSDRYVCVVWILLCGFFCVCLLCVFFVVVTVVTVETCEKSLRRLIF